MAGMHQIVPKYHAQAANGKLFSGTTEGAVTTTVGLATTYTGLVLTNPILSAKILTLHKVGLAIEVVFPAIASIGLMCGYKVDADSTGLTAVSVYNRLVGSNVADTGASGLLSKAATLSVAPTLREILASGNTGAMTTIPDIKGDFDLDGSIQLQPGGFVAIYTSAVSGTSGLWASMMWSERPAADLL